MVSYTDLSPLKQPKAPVAVDLNAPMPQQKESKARKDSKAGHPGRRRRSSNKTSPEEWQRTWDKLNNKVLYFKGVTEDALPELQRLFKSCRGIRLNVDPHESLNISGNVEFRNVYDTERAMAVLNNRRLNDTEGTLVMTPLTDSEIGLPPNAGPVCIKHIPDDATEASLYDLLRPSGTLYSCSIPTRPKGQNNGTAYACYVELAYAEVAIAQLNFSEYLGNTVSIQLTRQPRDKTLPSGDGHGNETTNANGSKAEPQKPGPTLQESPRSSRNDRCKDNGTTEATPVSRPEHIPTPPHESQQQQQQSSSRCATSPGSSTTEVPGGGLGGVIVPGKLFVTNLHATVSHKELFALFKKYGYIQSARVSIEPTTKKSRGHGIVQFSDPNAALEALRECQNADIKGRKITLYQYEHVNRQPLSSPRGADGASQSSDEPQRSHEPGPELEDISQPDTVPFPRSDSVSSTQQNDPLLDPAILRNLSEGSRNEILMQKLVATVAANPAVDVQDASRIVDSFVQRPLEDVLAMLSDPALLASEWEHEQRASTHLPQYMQTLTTPVSQAASPTGGASDEADGGAEPVAQQQQQAAVDECREQAQPERERIHLPEYDTETEEFIEMLLSKPENVRKMKLGSKLFPMIKGMGYIESTKLTVWILDHMGQDVRTLAYTLNDTARLREIVDEAQQAIGAGRIG